MGSTAEDVNKQKKTRERIKEEFRSTERTYNAALNNFVNNFLAPLKVNPDLKNNKNAQALIQECDKLLPIVTLSNQILNKFEKAKEDIDFAQIMKESSSQYAGYAEFAKSYERMNSLMAKLNKDPKFSKFHQEFTQGSKGLNAESHIIMPIQRIPRYELLLQQLQNYTPQTLPNSTAQGAPVPNPVHEALGQAHAATKAAATDINELKRQAEVQELKASLEEAYSKDYSSSENEQARSVGFSTNNDEFFKISLIDQEKLKASLDEFQIRSVETTVNERLGLKKKECVISATVNGEEVNFRVKGGYEETGLQGKDKSKNFHIVIDTNMQSLKEEERQKLYQAAQNIGKAVIKSIEGSPQNTFQVSNPSVSKMPQALDLKTPPSPTPAPIPSTPPPAASTTSLAARLTNLQSASNALSQQMIGGTILKVRSVSPSSSPQPLSPASDLEADKTTKMRNSEISLESVARKIMQSINAYNAEHPQAKINWKVELSRETGEISVTKPSETQPGKSEPLFSVKQISGQTQFEFQEQPMSLQSAVVALSACESPVEINSADLTDMEALAKAATTINASKGTQEEPMALVFTKETMEFLESKQADLDKFPALKEAFESQSNKTQNKASLK